MRQRKRQRTWEIEKILYWYFKPYWENQSGVDKSFIQLKHINTSRGEDYNCIIVVDEKLATTFIKTI